MSEYPIQMLLRHTNIRTLRHEHDMPCHFRTLEEEVKDVKDEILDVVNILKHGVIFFASQEFSTQINLIFWSKISC